MIVIKYNKHRQLSYNNMILLIYNSTKEFQDSLNEKFSRQMCAIILINITVIKASQFFWIPFLTLAFDPNEVEFSQTRKVRLE